jgi:hypothetical protein
MLQNYVQSILMLKKGCNFFYKSKGDPRAYMGSVFFFQGN